MKILVTGGAGFIGSHLVDAYLKRGDQVVIVDDLSSGSKANIKEALSQGARLVEMSLQSPELRDLLAQEKFDFISHHAAQKSVRDSVDHPMKDADINIMGFLNLLEAARKAGTKNVLFASSGGVVYGEQEVFPATESHSKRPVSPYGVTKLCSELYMDFYAIQWGFQCVALRYANIFGPRQDPLGEAGVVAIFCSKMMKQDPTVIYGSGRQTRDFVYVADVVSANLQATKWMLSQKVSGFKAWNIGTSIETSVIDLHQKLSKVAQYQHAARFEREKQGEQLRSCLAFSAFQEATGWKPIVSIDYGLQKTFEWFKSESSPKI